jgi:hypothetical protein
MSESTLRVAFVNHSTDTPVTVHIVTLDTVETCELGSTTPATLPDGAGTKHAAGAFDLVVPAGKVYGFTTENPVNITNPSPSIVQTVYADGKNPWPQPPPPAPAAFTGVTDFATRYGNFLMVGGIPSRKRRPIVMTLTPG